MADSQQADVTAIANGEKRDRFVKQAEIRVNKALKAIASIAIITDLKQYQYSDEDREQIIAALNEKIEFVNGAFTDNSPKNVDFTLK